jgi:hypothetical protein
VVKLEAECIKGLLVWLKQTTEELSLIDLFFEFWSIQFGLEIAHTFGTSGYAMYVD